MTEQFSATEVDPITIVRVIGYGGFPVSNIAYWKVCHVSTTTGEGTILHVQFRTGGFLEIPSDVMTEDVFASLVYGVPF